MMKKKMMKMKMEMRIKLALMFGGGFPLSSDMQTVWKTSNSSFAASSPPHPPPLPPPPLPPLPVSLRGKLGGVADVVAAAFVRRFIGRQRWRHGERRERERTTKTETETMTEI